MSVIKPLTPEGTPTSRRLAGKFAFAGVLLLFAAWSAWFIYRSSVVVGGERIFCLFDDAMISMTYARNLTEGYGLSWAREGPPTEGFTTPSWTFAMVPVNLLPLPLAQRSLVVQLLSMLLLLANLVAVGLLTRRYFCPPARGVWLPAVVLAATFYPLNYWALMGMETGLLALLATVSMLLAYEIVECGRNRVVALSAVLSLAYLTRMDLLLLVGAVLAYVAAHRGLRREHSRSWLAGSALLCASTIGYQVFRVAYFGAPLPTTYYLPQADGHSVRGPAAAGPVDLRGLPRRELGGARGARPGDRAVPQAPQGLPPAGRALPRLFAV